MYAHYNDTELMGIQSLNLVKLEGLKSLLSCLKQVLIIWRHRRDSPGTPLVYQMNPDEVFSKPCDMWHDAAVSRVYRLPPGKDICVHCAHCPSLAGVQLSQRELITIVQKVVPAAATNTALIFGNTWISVHILQLTASLRRAIESDVVCSVGNKICQAVL